MEIREATADDLDQILDLFEGTILHVNANDYSPEQIAVWKDSKDRSIWLQKIANQSFFVSHLAEKITGFSSIDAEGYLDFMYVHKDHQREGIAQLLLKKVEQQARIAKLRRIWSSVSISAQPFFTKHGFTHYEDEHKMLSGVHFKNALMEKILE